MKRTASIIISIVVAITMIGTDVFAATNSANTGKAAPKIEDKTAGSTKTNKTEAGKATGKTATEKVPGKTKKKPAEKLPKLAKPRNIHAYSGYRSVKLTWNAVPKAEEYIILRSIAGKKKFKQIGKTKQTNYVDKMDYIYNYYAYRVVATMKYKNKVIKSPPAKVREHSVMRLRIYITFKKTRKIDGLTIRKGTTLRSDAFAGGQYYFTYKGRRLAVPRIMVDVEGKKYEEKDNYTKNDAALFINEIVHRKKIKTNKKYLIWVSTHTQHLYVFKRKNGKWRVVKDWEVSTGRAVSPTSTGLKRIHKKVFSRHGINFWSCFSNMNALHGISGNMGASIGKLASSGCVRNHTSDAAWIYAKCGKGTRVLIY